MLKRFAVDETLYSTMGRLRGKYAILTVKELRLLKPDEAKIIAFRQRGRALSVKMRYILSDPLKEKEKAIKDYVKELHRLKGLNQK